MTTEQELERTKARLKEAEILLSEARSLLDDVHCYNSQIYHEIGVFLYGEDD